jgi:hypothetical protein
VGRDRDTGQRGHYAPKHVWVNVTANAAYRSPGILLGWRRADGGRWEAHVMWAEGGGNIRPRAHLEWVRAEHVSQIAPPAS